VGALVGAGLSPAPGEAGRSRLPREPHRPLCPRPQAL